MTDDLYERYKESLRVGHVAVLRGSLNAALEAYRSAAEVAPSRALPHTSLGGVLLRLGQLDEALVEYAAAVARAPQDEGALLGQAEALSLAGRKIEAASALDRVAEIQAESNRLPEAADTLRRAMEFSNTTERGVRQHGLQQRVRLSAGDQAAEELLARAMRFRDVPVVAAAPVERRTEIRADVQPDVQAAPVEEPAVAPAQELAVEEPAGDQATHLDTVDAAEPVALAEVTAELSNQSEPVELAAIEAMPDASEPEDALAAAAGQLDEHAASSEPVAEPVTPESWDRWWLDDEPHAPVAAISSQAEPVGTNGRNGNGSAGPRPRHYSDEQLAAKLAAAELAEAAAEARRAAEATAAAVTDSAVVSKSGADAGAAEIEVPHVAPEPEKLYAAPWEDRRPWRPEAEDRLEAPLVGVMEAAGAEAEAGPSGDELTAAAEAADNGSNAVVLRSMLLAASRAYAREGRFEAALDSAHRLLRAGPSDVETHLVLVELYMARDWNALAQEKLALLERLATLSGDEDTRKKVCGIASRAFPHDERLGSACAQ